MTTWFSFLRCVCVCVCVGGVGGAKPTPRQKPLDPISKRSCNLPRTASVCQLEPPGHCRRPVTRQTFVKSVSLRYAVGPIVQFHSHLIPLGYFVVFVVSVDPCCPVPRRPAFDGCVTTVRYRCPLTRMTCVSCELPVSTCRRWCSCACDRDRTTTTPRAWCPVSAFADVTRFVVRSSPHVHREGGWGEGTSPPSCPHCFYVLVFLVHVDHPV